REIEDRYSGNVVFYHLLFRAADSRRVRAVLNGTEDHRERQPGLHICTVAVLRSVGYRSFVPAGGVSIRCDGEKHRGKGAKAMTAVVIFLMFIGATLVITYWAARRSRGTTAYFAANRQITAWQNGFAVAGDYMSAASFLGIAGIIAFQG